MNYILTDVGGTQTRIGLSRDLETIADKVVYDTPQDYSEGIEKFISNAQKLSNNEKIESLVMGIAGPMNKEKTQLIKAPHLTDWCGKDIKTDLENKLSTEIYLENDTALVGLGEAVRGAGVGNRIVVYITISTGIGGVRIVDGKIDRNAFGFEPGHQIVDIDGDGLRSVESLVAGGYYNKIDNDEAKSRFIKNAPKYASIGIFNSILHWSPDIVVIGGGMINHAKISFDEITNNINKLNDVFEETPAIKKSELEDLGGLFGGMSYLKHKI